MGFDGIIATDALDMAGIAHYFDDVTAVVETFVAGADLAVMPFTIRKVEDIEQFYQFIKNVAKRLQQKIHDNRNIINRINAIYRENKSLQSTSIVNVPKIFCLLNRSR